MSKLGRRLVLRGSVGLAAAGTFASPYIANAQAKTATRLVGPGLRPGRGRGVQELVADYEKASGNKIDFSIIPFVPLRSEDRLGADQRRRARHHVP